MPLTIALQNSVADQVIEQRPADLRRDVASGELVREGHHRV
jgi:hypothetical protein